MESNSRFCKFLMCMMMMNMDSNYDSNLFLFIGLDMWCIGNLQATFVHLNWMMMMVHFVAMLVHSIFVSNAMQFWFTFYHAMVIERKWNGLVQFNLVLLDFNFYAKMCVWWWYRRKSKYDLWVNSNFDSPVVKNETLTLCFFYIHFVDFLYA